MITTKKEIVRKPRKTRKTYVVDFKNLTVDRAQSVGSSLDRFDRGERFTKL